MKAVKGSLRKRKKERKERTLIEKIKKYIFSLKMIARHGKTTTKIFAEFKM